MLSPAPLKSLQQLPDSQAGKMLLPRRDVFPLNYLCHSAKLDENLQIRGAAPCKPSSPTGPSTSRSGGGCRLLLTAP